MTETGQAEANLLNLLIVDDERAIRDGCREIAQAIGFSTLVADDTVEAAHLLEASGADVVLLDLRLPGGSGLELLREIKHRRPETVVIVITAFATVQSAVEAMKNGAYDYVTKPFNMEELRLLLERVVRHLHLTNENRILREQLKSKEGMGPIVGRAPEMERLYRIVSKAAQSSHPVLILGESGTGKELVARSIHYAGPHRDQPFVPVDCGSLVPNLIESELFGHVKGAFTGAHRAKDGLLAVAEGHGFSRRNRRAAHRSAGQAAARLAGKRDSSGRRHPPVPINARILAATNRDLEQAVAQGNFRRDLYFRLNVLTLRIPPLRSRRQDIPLLVGHFLESMGRLSGMHRNISDDALKLMLAYDWPGNVRELENCLQRACAMTSGPTIHTVDLPTADPELARAGRSGRSRTAG